MTTKTPSIKPGFVRGLKGYPIKIGGPTFNKLGKVKQQQLILEAGQGTIAQKLAKSESKLSPNYVYSPTSKKPIKIGGQAFKKLTFNQQNIALKNTGLESLTVVKRSFKKTKRKRLISPKIITIPRRTSFVRRTSPVRTWK